MRTHGFTLGEVAVALVLLVVAVTATADLFVFGQRRIQSARGTTEALAVARSILEELDARSYHTLYRSLGHDGSTASHRVDSLRDAEASVWQPSLRSGLGSSRAVIELLSLDGRPLSEARGMRVRVSVRWREASGRPRRLRLVTVRT